MTQLGSITERDTVLQKIPGSMLGSCRAAGYCTESWLQNLSVALYFAVHGKNPRTCYFFMKLWWTWLMPRIRLAAPYGGFWIAYLQIQGQIFRGAHSQLSKHSAAKLQARSRNWNNWTGTKLLWTSQTNWLIPLLADIPVTEVETAECSISDALRCEF